MQEPLISRLCRLLRNFRVARGGNVVITFALASVPVVVGVGSAIDYSRANALKAALQAAVDSTALKLAKDAGNLSSAELQTEADDFFTSVFNRPDAKKTNVNVVSNARSSTVQVTGKAKMATSIMSIVGIRNIKLSATATAAWAAAARLRVALVLDNTGSMSEAGKMPALQTAAKNMLSKLASADTTSDDVYVSIIPFAKDVNLSSGSNKASWLDWTEWNEVHGSCSDTSFKSKTDCKNVKGNTWTNDDHSTWNGCVVDRGDATGPNVGDYDTNATSPSTAIAATMYVAEQYSDCPQAVMGLSDKWNNMRSLVDAMTPRGNTNQALGLQIGWMSLTQNGMFTTPAEDPSVSYSKHIVLLTDGLNTENRWYKDQASIDAREQLLCNNIKAAGITLWTIQVNTGSDPTSSLLQNCASSPDKFFLLTSAQQIVSTFDDISFKITKLHLAK